MDENVLCEHNEAFCPYTCLVVPSGERYKTLETVEKLYRDLVKIEADRSTLLVGVGGGLATDVAGFVASTFLQGAPFWIYIHIPAWSGGCQHWREERGKPGWI